MKEIISTVLAIVLAVIMTSEGVEDAIIISIGIGAYMWATLLWLEGQRG